MSGRRTAEYPRPSHFVLHLSDTHLMAGPDPLYGVVDSEARLRQIFTEVAASHARPDALVFTGDLTDKGEPGAYAKLRAIVEPVATALGAQVIWAMGNHDDRAHFRTQLLDQEPSADPIDRVHDVDGLRIVTLDSTVPGHHHGEISDRQLEWLADQLATAAPHGTILALHHPPVPCVLDLAVLVELRDQARLADVLRGSDVRAILAGHLHYSTTATFAGIPVSVASATCYTQDLNVPSGALRGRDGAQGFNLVHVYPDTLVHSVVPTGTYDTVGEYVDPEETARRLAAAHVRIPGAGEADVSALWEGRQAASQGAGIGK
ncbi:phosphodiesterase [Rhodococcus triatomae]|uniref:Calcineurin-like phosphoesterase n=1 Tax=Rhodococcus triatomae TaxID=300028 RepID=A0A1G8A0N0_9NOCA|nr:phosphodiesterase [Rhodococcus triatomae]QNG17892.1 phosphodiesterase [Rhodococcus triatomae]QNG22440.1 phosphodiesterase [Rhodococcus triatomae]SDH14494.1 Calcineurin-like phosphoesterase [Rhodococcus triatomae]